MVKMTELEAWKVLYNWAMTAPASADSHFKEARREIGRLIKLVEKANNNPAAFWKRVNQSLAENGYVCVMHVSAEDVRSFAMKNSSCNQLPSGFSDEEIIKEVKSIARRESGMWSARSLARRLVRLTAFELSKRAGLEWSEDA
jgi:hypothetical protein